MQVIDELEDLPRGPYCGAVGCLSTSGDLRLGVSIRTAAFQGDTTNGFEDVKGTLAYGTGCGIVADSQPKEEFRESEHKTEAMMRLSD
jgi:anthranilate/para-aminobenzoate synthase component I